MQSSDRDQLAGSAADAPPEAEESAGVSAAIPAPVGAVPAKKSFLKQAIGLCVAALFLWLSFRNTDLGQLWQRMQHLNYWFLVALVVTSVLSHWLRAVRWVIMLNPLASERSRQEMTQSKDHVSGASPAQSLNLESKPTVSVFNSFCAIMYGYAVNIVIPRGGEVARVVSICKSERLPWVGVLPTMFIDRLLDIALLVLLIGITLLMLPVEIKSHMSWLVPAGGLMCVATFAGLALLPYVGTVLRKLATVPAIAFRIPVRYNKLAIELSDQFDQGTLCLKSPAMLPVIALLSCAIWFFYWLNLWMMVWAFGMQNSVDLARSLMVFTIGSVGVLVPTPGCVGTYHYCVSQALHLVANIDLTQALAFATLSHALSFVLIASLVAAVCFLIQTSKSKK